MHLVEPVWPYWADWDAKQNNVFVVSPPFFYFFFVKEIKQQMAYFNRDKNMPLYILLPIFSPYHHSLSTCKNLLVRTCEFSLYTKNRVLDKDFEGIHHPCPPRHR